MPLIPDEQLDQIRDRVDIVQFISESVPLNKAGRNFKGLCPFHAEKTPSFMVSAEKQIFHCFGCGEGGNVFTFLMKFEGIGFVEAAQRLADRGGIALRLDSSQETRTFQEKQRLTRLNRLAAEFFFNQLHRENAGKRALDYVAEREIDRTTAERYLLGYAPETGRSLVRYLQSRKVPLDLAEQAGLIRSGSDGEWYDFFRGRLIFPIRNSAGDFIGFGGRVLGAAGPKQPKYLNTPESPLYHKGREVYGLFEARASLREQQQALLVEGYMDVIALCQHGFSYAVAPLGTALTSEQVLRISRHVRELLVLFDGDRAGQTAAWRALEPVIAAQVPTRLVVLPAGDDPDSLVRREGAEVFGAQLLAAPGIMDYFIDKIVAQSPPDNVGRIEAARKLLPQLMRVPGEVEKTLYIQRLASKLGLPEAVLHKEISAQGQAGRNFPPQQADDNDARRHGVLGLTPFERDLMWAVVSDEAEAHDLIEELESKDWRHPELRKGWPHIQRCLQEKRSVAILLQAIADTSLSQELTELFVTERDWDDVKAAELLQSCRRRLQERHVTLRRQELTRQIREAEAQADLSRVQELLVEQNRLM